jgi:hypothetical protein
LKGHQFGLVYSALIEGVTDMLFQRWKTLTLRLAFAASCVVLSADATRADEKIQLDGKGTGVYIPATGYYYGPGEEKTLGPLIFNGTIETEPTGPLTFSFQNLGRGTSDETLHEAIYEDGSSVSVRFQGTAELIPIDNGNFTAVWLGVMEIVRGTGKMRGAKGKLDVVAENKPFKLTDPFWEFEWIWSGEIKTKKNALKKYMVLETGGFGVFDPANLGVGDPDVLPFPIIIGDGSGVAVYDGTPTGFEFKLDGILVGDGYDRHFGSALSLTPGIPVGSVVQYPGIEEENPDGPGRKIHIMDTRIGELWLQKVYYFELDPEAGSIIARVDFRVVGGTAAFEGASGSIYCRVFIDLADVSEDEEGDVNAPFRYDFDGYISL